MRIFKSYLCAILVSACLLGCSGGSGGLGGDSNAIASITIVDGNNQTATVGTELTRQLMVLVQNSTGQPVAGQIVNFVVTSGGGAVLAGSALSDANGLASERWTLGTSVGTQTVEARATNTSGGVATMATFSATATASIPATLTKVSGDAQAIAQHSKLPTPFIVRVTDSLGNNVPGAQVTFSSSTGSGYVQPSVIITDGGGTASWLGYLHVSGQEKIVATVTGLTPVTFTTTVTPSSHRFDGWYMCNLSNSITYMYGTATYFQLPMINGVITSNGEGHGLYNPNYIVGNGSSTGTFSEATGVWTADLIAGAGGPTSYPNTLELSLAGTLTVDSLEISTGAGTYTDNNGGSGTFTCERLYKW